MTATPAPPETLRAALDDRYRLEREIGRGGMATVYLATDVKHGREVAIKVLKPDLAASLGADRFLREIEIAARLNHPHVLPLLDSADLDGTLLYVMPFVDGESLRSLIERDGTLDTDHALTITSEVASALAYAHRQGVVHRDIKPENILLSQGHAVVADFGIAKAVSSIGGQELTRTGFPIGTPGYMSPEQAAGLVDLDARSDVFSLACVVYEMLVGDAPRFWLSEEAVRAGRLLDAPAKHRPLLDALPGQVEPALAAALVLKPDDRTVSPADFVDALTTPIGRDRRRYSDNEVQDIVRRAAEAEARPTDAGMTIGGVQALGAEVGIEANEVAKAARALESRTPSRSPSKFGIGAALSYHARDDLRGRVNLADQVEVLDIIREVMREPGKATEVMGTLEWRLAGLEKDHVTVTIAPKRDDVRVTVLATRHQAAALTTVFSLLVCVGGAIVLANAEGAGLAGGLASVGMGTVAGLTVARTILVASGKRLTRKLDRMRAEIRRYIESGESGS